MLACMLHAHLGNMGSPGTFQATFDQLFAANGLTHIIIPQNPDSAKIFGVVPGGQYPPGHFEMNTSIETPEPMEAETPEIVVAQQDTETSTGVREKRIRDPRKLKHRHKELTRLWKKVPAFKEMLALRVLPVDRPPKISNVYSPWARKDRITSVLQFYDPRDVNPGLMMDLKGPISEADVEYLFLDGLIQECEYETITVDSESVKEVRLGLLDSFERGLVEPAPKVLLIEKA